MVYYATRLLWLKLIDVKAKQNREALTSEENHCVKQQRKWSLMFRSPSPHIWTKLDSLVTKREKLRT